MKQYATESADYKLQFSGPDTNDEYDQAAGSVNAACRDAVGGLIAWDTLPTWQQKFAKKLEELTSEAKRVNEKKTAKAREKKADAKEIKESDLEYIRRVTAAFPDQKATFQQAASDVASTVSVDASPSRRVGKPKASDLAKADEWIAQGTDFVESKLTQYNQEHQNLPEVDRDNEGAPERESLARWFAALVAAVQAKLVAGL